MASSATIDPCVVRTWGGLDLYGSHSVIGFGIGMVRPVYVCGRRHAGRLVAVPMDRIARTERVRVMSKEPVTAREPSGLPTARTTLEARYVDLRLSLVPAIAQRGSASPRRCWQRRRAAGPSAVPAQLLRAPQCRCPGGAKRARVGTARMAALMAARRCVKSLRTSARVNRQLGRRQEATYRRRPPLLTAT